MGSIYFHIYLMKLLLFENLNQAYSVLKKAGKDKTGPEFQLIQNNIPSGYIGIITKLYFNEPYDLKEFEADLKTCNAIFAESGIDAGSIKNNTIKGFIEDYKIKLEDPDLELVESTASYNIFRIKTYAGILKKGSTAWCLKTKSNWEQYGGVTGAIQYVAIHKSFDLDLPTPMYTGVNMTTLGPERIGWTTRPKVANNTTIVCFNEKNSQVDYKWVEKMVGINIWRLDITIRKKYGFPIWEDHIKNAPDDVIIDLLDDTLEKDYPKILLNILQINDLSEDTIKIIFDKVFEYYNKNIGDLYNLNYALDLFKAMFSRDSKLLDQTVENHDMAEVWYIEEFLGYGFIDDLPKTKKLIEQNIDINDILTYGFGYFNDFLIENYKKISPYSFAEYIWNYDFSNPSTKLIKLYIELDQFKKHIYKDNIFHLNLLICTYGLLPDTDIPEEWFDNKYFDTITGVLVNKENKAGNPDIIKRVNDRIAINLLKPTEEMVIKYIETYRYHYALDNAYDNLKIILKSTLAAKWIKSLKALVNAKPENFKEEYLDLIETFEDIKPLHTEKIKKCISSWINTLTSYKNLEDMPKFDELYLKD